MVVRSAGASDSDDSSDEVSSSVSECECLGAEGFLGESIG